MVRRIVEEKRPVGEVAAGFGASERTAQKWLARWKREGAVGLENRSSRPCTVANRLAEAAIALIEQLRREYRLTGEAIAGKLALALSTSTSRSSPASSASAIASPATAAAPAKASATTSSMSPSTTPQGSPASRSCPMRSEPRPPPDPALRWFKQHGIRVEQVMTDNGSGYVARLFGKILRMLNIRHFRTRPYTPKTNGKAERFIQTGLREWAYAIPFASSATRADDLPRWLDCSSPPTPC
jgi:hypothetical protein